MNKGTKITLIGLGILGVGVGLYFVFRKKPPYNQDPKKEDKEKKTKKQGTKWGDDSFPLKRGSKGNRVKALQKYLNDSSSGYALATDGLFGPLTEAAVQSEQTPFEQFKVGYPNAVFGQVSEEYYNDFVVGFE